MDAPPLCPAPAELRLEYLVVSPKAITVVATARRCAAPCPLCGCLSRRLPSRYTRTLADLPGHGVRVSLEAHVRRLFCGTPGCRRRICTERLPATMAPHARRTARAAAALELLGFAVGGRPGARLAAALGLVGGAWAIRARVHRAPEVAPPTPRVLGVDDWALRRGRRCGTTLLDLERHAVTDLLPDREAATFAGWLAAHPGVEVISRDRGGAYAEGARQGAPAATQAADRFHLLRHLMDAPERACLRHHAALRTAAEVTHPKPLAKEASRKRRYSGPPHNRPGPTRDEQQSAARRARRLARYEQVVALRAGGVSKLGIARTVGLDRRTVDTWRAAGPLPERAPKARQPHRLDPHVAFIVRRSDEGLTNAAQLARELRGRGVGTSDQAVRRYLAALRRLRPQAGGAQPARPPPRVPMPAPSPRQTAWLLRNVDRTPDELTDDERAFVATVCAPCPALAQARTLVGDFARLLERHDAAALVSWLTAAERSDACFGTGSSIVLGPAPTTGTLSFTLTDPRFGSGPFRVLGAYASYLVQVEDGFGDGDFDDNVLSVVIVKIKCMLGDPVLDDIVFRLAADEALRSSKIADPNPANRIEQFGFVWQNKTTGAIRVQPMAVRAATACDAELPPPPHDTESERLVAVYHTHPSFRHESMRHCNPNALPYNPDANGGGSDADWNYANEFGVDVNALGPDRVWRLDTSTPQRDWSRNENGWDRDTKKCPWLPSAP